MSSGGGFVTACGFMGLGIARFLFIGFATVLTVYFLLLLEKTPSSAFAHIGSAQLLQQGWIDVLFRKY